MVFFEIKSGKINGTDVGGTDYKEPSFRSGKFTAIDPRLWLKNDTRTNPQSATRERCNIALRVEQTGFLFLVWYRGAQVGSRQGDGAFVYVFVPFGYQEKKSGQLTDLLWDILEETRKGNVRSNEETTADVSGKGKVAIMNPRDGKYAYVRCEVGKNGLQKWIDQRYQVVFGQYEWVVLYSEMADPKDDFMVSGARDITGQKVEYFFLETPQPIEHEGVTWMPKLMQDNKWVNDGDMIYRKESKRNVRWNPNSSEFLYMGGDPKITFDQIKNKEYKSLFHSDFVYRKHFLEKTSVPNGLEKMAAYYVNGKSYAIEYDASAKSYMVYLPAEESSVSWENVRLKDISKSVEPDSGTKKVYHIFDGDCNICSFSGERISQNNQYLEGPTQVNGSSEYRLKLKKNNSMPPIWLIVLLSALIGIAVGFFVVPKVDKLFGKEHPEKLIAPPQPTSNGPIEKTEKHEQQSETTSNNGDNIVNENETAPSSTGDKNKNEVSGTKEQDEAEAKTGSGKNVHEITVITQLKGKPNKAGGKVLFGETTLGENEKKTLKVGDELVAKVNDTFKFEGWLVDGKSVSGETYKVKGTEKEIIAKFTK